MIPGPVCVCHSNSQVRQKTVALFPGLHLNSKHQNVQSQAYSYLDLECSDDQHRKEVTWKQYLQIKSTTGNVPVQCMTVSNAVWRWTALGAEFKDYEITILL